MEPNAVSTILDLMPRWCRTFRPSRTSYGLRAAMTPHMSLPHHLGSDAVLDDVVLDPVFDAAGPRAPRSGSWLRLLHGEHGVTCYIHPVVVIALTAHDALDLLDDVVDDLALDVC